jgi:hypothetical protein
MDASSPPVVCWLIAAQRRLVTGITGCLPEDDWPSEYHRLCGLLAETFPHAAAIIVRDRLHGYRNRGNCHILVVEVIHKWCDTRDETPMDWSTWQLPRARPLRLGPVLSFCLNGLPSCFEPTKLNI